MNKKILISLVLCVIVLLLAGCAAPVVVTGVGKAAGFWAGLWHGFISPYAFIGSWFSDNIVIYSAYNTGVLYDLGFLMGISGILGGATAAKMKKGK